MAESDILLSIQELIQSQFKDLQQEISKNVESQVQKALERRGVNLGSTYAPQDLPLIDDDGFYVEPKKLIISTSRRLLDYLTLYMMKFWYCAQLNGSSVKRSNLSINIASTFKMVNVTKSNHI